MRLASVFSKPMDLTIVGRLNLVPVLCQLYTYKLYKLGGGLGQSDVPYAMADWQNET